MVLLTIGSVFAVVMIWLALRANTRFSGERRLPMQWWLNGDVTWYAPRRVALAFIPTVSIIVLALYVALSRTTKPRAGDEHLVIPAMLFMGFLFLGIQWLHLYLVRKTLLRNGG
jgi:uncharacterized membrane protein YedE/YeeE